MEVRHKVDIKTGGDIFGAKKFKYDPALDDYVAYLFDPILGGKKYFYRDRLYFDILDDSVKGIIGDYEDKLKGMK